MKKQYQIDAKTSQVYIDEKFNDFTIIPFKKFKHDSTIWCFDISRAIKL